MSREWWNLVLFPLLQAGRIRKRTRIVTITLGFRFQLRGLGFTCSQRNLMERLPNLSETLRSVRLRTRTTGGRSSAWGCRVACGELPPPQLLKGVGFLPSALASREARQEMCTSCGEAPPNLRLNAYSPSKKPTPLSVSAPTRMSKSYRGGTY